MLEAAKPATSTSVEDRNASDGDVDHTAAEEGYIRGT